MPPEDLFARVAAELARPAPPLAAWVALEQAWREADAAWFEGERDELASGWRRSAGRGRSREAVDAQLRCLIVRDRLLRVHDSSAATEAMRGGLDGWDVDALVQLGRRRGTRDGARLGWDIDGLISRLDRSGVEALLDELVLDDHGEDSLRAVVGACAEAGWTALALRALAQIRQPFFYLDAAEAMLESLESLESLDRETQARVAEAGWSRISACAQFDRYGPSYSIALWLGCLQLWPRDDPELPSRVAWLEQRVRLLGPGELEPSQDYEDLRYCLARAWARLGEFERARMWIARIEDWPHLWSATLARELPPTERRELALEALRGELRDHEQARAEAKPAYVPYSTLECLGELGEALCVELAEVIAAALADSPLDRHRWLLGLLPWLPQTDRAACWREALACFEREAHGGPREALDELLESLVEMLAHAPHEAASLLPWLASWPRAEPFEGAGPVWPPAQRERAFEQLLARAPDPASDWRDVVVSFVDEAPELAARLGPAWTGIIVDRSGPEKLAARVLMRRAASPRPSWMLDAEKLSIVLTGLPDPLRGPCLDVYAARSGLELGPRRARILELMQASRWRQAALLGAHNQCWLHALVRSWIDVDPAREVPDEVDGPAGLLRWLAEQPAALRVDALASLGPEADRIADAWTQLPEPARGELAETLRAWLREHRPRTRLDRAARELLGLDELPARRALDGEVRLALDTGDALALRPLLELACVRDAPAVDLTWCAREAARAGHAQLLTSLLREHAAPVRAARALVDVLEHGRLRPDDHAVVHAALVDVVLRILRARAQPDAYLLAPAYEHLPIHVLARIWELRACRISAPTSAVNTSEISLAVRLGGPERLATLLDAGERLLGPVDHSISPVG